jgi:hypothetical protein
MKAPAFLVPTAMVLMMAGAASAAPPMGAAGSATGGTGGSAAAGGTSASTLGLGGTSTGPEGSSSSLGVGGSAATDEGRASTHSNVSGGGPVLNGHAKAQAQDKGTFSKSMTHTKVKRGKSVGSRTKTMSHVPGEKPVMSRSTINEEVPQQ